MAKGILAPVLALALGAAAAPVFDVTQFGAVGDGKTDDTKAVRATFAAAASAGPSTVVFPSGKTFLTGAFNLSANLVLDVSGTVLAYPTGDDGHYVLAPNLPWFGEGLTWQAFIHSEGADNITLLSSSKQGVVDGNGALWWACGCHGPPPPLPPNNMSAPCLGYERPKLFNPVNGTGLVVRDIVFQNSPMWNLRPSWFTDVLIENVTVLAPIGIACNTDGIDPDASQNVVVRNSYINVGDDAIAVKSGYNWYGRTYGRPSRNITFSNMRIGTGHGVSVGSEMSGGVYDVLFENFVCNGTWLGPRVKTERGRGGLVANITFRNFTLIDVGEASGGGAFQITETYIDPPPPQNASATPHFANITIDGLTLLGTKTRVGTYLYGLPESVMQGIVLRDVDVRAATEQPIGTCQDAVGVCEGSVLPACPPCLTPA